MTKINKINNYCGKATLETQQFQNKQQLIKILWKDFLFQRAGLKLIFANLNSDAMSEGRVTETVEIWNVFSLFYKDCPVLVFIFV